MLRFIVLALVLLNGVYFAWSHGHLQGLGFAPTAQTEPQRMAQQVRPQNLRLLTPQELRQATAPPPQAGAPGECLQVGLFDETQSAALRAALAAQWPPGSWQLTETPQPARWIVYMGKFANPAELAKKRLQLAALNLKFEPLQNPALGPGLSLGGFETQAAATAALEALTQRGVRTARVLQEHAEVQGFTLLLPALDDALKTRLTALTPALAGKRLIPCR